MKRDGTDTVIAVAALAAVLVTFALVEAWLVMLGAGGLHHEVSSSIPAFGYGGAVLVTVALNTVVALFSPRA